MLIGKEHIKSLNVVNYAIAFTKTFIKYDINIHTIITILFPTFVSYSEYDMYILS